MKKIYKIPLVLSASFLGLNIYSDSVYAENVDEHDISIDETENLDTKILEIEGSLRTNNVNSNYQLVSDTLIEYDWHQNEGNLQESDTKEFSQFFSIRISEEELLHNKNETVLIFRDLEKNINLATYILTYISSTGEYEFTEISEDHLIDQSYDNQLIITIVEEENEILDAENKVNESMEVIINDISINEVYNFDEIINVDSTENLLKDEEAEVALSSDGTGNLSDQNNDTQSDLTEPVASEDLNESILVDEYSEETELTEVSTETESTEKLTEPSDLDLNSVEVNNQTDSHNSSLSIASISSSEISSISNFNAPSSALFGESYILNTSASPSSTSLYKYWIRDNQSNEWIVLKDYDDNPSFNWTPSKSGDFRLVVHVKHTNSNKDYDDYKFVDLNVPEPEFSIQNFSVIGNGFIGKPYALSTSVIGAKEELYKYWVQDLATGSWEILRDYSIHPDYDWSPKKAGKYKLVVHSKERLSVNEYDDFTYKYVTVKEPELDITEFNIVESGHAGLPYTISSQADSTNNAHYKYLIQDISSNTWEMIQDYSTNSQATWVPKKSGEYKIVLHSKDEFSDGKYDDYRYKTVTVKEPQLSINSLSVNGEGYAGSQYMINSSTTGSDKPMYKFWIQDDSTKTWEVIKDYSSASQVNWTPQKPGKYKIVLHSKDTLSQLDYDDYKYKYVDIEPATSNISQFEVLEAEYSGAEYKLKATSISDNVPLYKFIVQDYSTNEWKIIKDWSEASEINWVPEKPGQYRLVVHNKDNYSHKEFDDYKFKDVIVHAPFVYQTTQYDITFADALNKQMQYSPQTDLYGGGFKNARSEDVAYYLNPNNFVDKSIDFSESVSKRIKITTSVLNVRNGPSANYAKIQTVLENEVYNVLSEQYGWYKIDLGGSVGWVSGEYTSAINNVKVLKNLKLFGRVTANALNVRNGPGANFGIIDQVYLNNSFDILKEENGWYLLNLGDKQGWVSGDYLNVSSTLPKTMLQFLSLSNSSGIDVELMNQELKNKGILEDTGHVFIEASKKYNVNEIYLLSHALLETGNGSSSLATGVVVSEVDGVSVTPKKVYNMFGIAAFDNSPLKSGSEYAYKQGWDTPEKAISGGAEWIASKYVNNPTHKQDTLYKMRWNPTNPTSHQYATDIGWAVKQTHTLDFLVDISLRYNLVLKFDIPIYNN